MGNTSDNMMVDNEDIEFSVKINNDQSVEMSNRYELPPRKTRGVPPKRYDPEYEAKRSRYLADRNNVESLAQMALAFNASLYSNKIPRNVEEALQDPKWKRQWRRKYLHFSRMRLGKNVSYPKGKRQ